MIGLQIGKMIRTVYETQGHNYLTYFYLLSGARVGVMKKTLVKLSRLF